MYCNKLTEFTMGLDKGQTIGNVNLLHPRKCTYKLYSQAVKLSFSKKNIRTDLKSNLKSNLFGLKKYLSNSKTSLQKSSKKSERILSTLNSLLR